MTGEESLDRAQKHKWSFQLLLAFSIQVAPLPYTMLSRQEELPERQAPEEASREKAG